MITYLALFLVINLTFLTNFIPNKRIGKITAIAVPLTFLLLMMVFRDYSVGNDIVGYKAQFDNYLIATKMSAKKDYGFYTTLYLFAKTFKNFRAFLAFEYLIFYVGLALILYFYCKNTQVALLVFLFSPLFELSVSGLRQTFGIALCLFSIISFLKIKKPFNYIVSISLWIIACTMHACLIPFIFFFVFNKFKASLKYLWLYLFLFLLCAVSSKYLFYILDSFADLGYGASGVYLGLPKVALVYFAFFLAVLCFIDLPILKDKLSRFYEFTFEEKVELTKYLSLFFIYILFQSTVTYNLIFARFGIVFSIYLPLIFSNSFVLIKGKKARIVSYLAIVGLAIIAFWYENIHHDACGVYPFSWGVL